MYSTQPSKNLTLDSVARITNRNALFLLSSICIPSIESIFSSIHSTANVRETINLWRYYGHTSILMTNACEVGQGIIRKGSRSTKKLRGGRIIRVKRWPNLDHQRDRKGVAREDTLEGCVEWKRWQISLKHSFSANEWWSIPTLFWLGKICCINHMYGVVCLLQLRHLE